MRNGVVCLSLWVDDTTNAMDWQPIAFDIHGILLIT